MGRLVRSLAILLLSLPPAAGATPAGAAEQCNAISDENLRLACWDKLYPPVQGVSSAAASSSNEPSSEEPIEPIFWYTRTDTSAIDDSKGVYINIQSIGTVPGKYGDSQPAELLLRCSEHVTAVTLQLADNFMADTEGYGTVTYRIDQKPAQKKDFQESTDNSVLGLWSGGAAIPFIKSLFGAKTLIVRATPFNESAMEATFNITGTQEVVKPLRAACGW